MKTNRRLRIKYRIRKKYLEHRKFLDYLFLEVIEKFMHKLLMILKV